MTEITKMEPCMSDVHVPNAGGKKPKRTFKDYWDIRGMTKDYWSIRGMTKACKTFKDYWDIRRQTKGCNPKKSDEMQKGMVVKCSFVKADEDQHLVTGWASVIEENGNPIVDWQGDVMTESELVKAAHGFMENYRKGKTMHKGDATGCVVDSIVFTKAVQNALNIDLGKVGWLITTKVSDEDTWKKVKQGELKAFSIGGSGVRAQMD